MGLWAHGKIGLYRGPHQLTTIETNVWHVNLTPWYWKQKKMIHMNDEDYENSYIGLQN